MTTYALVRLRGLRAWRDDDGWHAVDRRTAGLIDAALDIREPAAYEPDLPRAELLWLAEVFGDLLSVDYLDPLPRNNDRDIIH